MDLRTLAKRAIEAVAVASGVPRRRIGRRSSGTVILSYHNVLPEGARAVGDRSLHIPQRRFAEHLERLGQTHDVVPLSELRVGETPPGRPRAVITFDDAYRGTITAGFHELALRRLPAAVFVPPGLLGGEGFWWDRLAPPGADLPAAVRDHVLEDLGGRGGDALDWARREAMPIADLPGHTRPAEKAELVGALARGSFELGSHTWSHVNLERVPDDEARREIERGHAWLDTLDESVPVVDWLAYPYGRFSDTAARIAGEFVAGAVRVEGGAAEVGGRWVSDPYRVPRVNVPAGLTADGLTLRLAGLL